LAISRIPDAKDSHCGWCQRINSQAVE